MGLQAAVRASWVALGVGALAAAVAVSACGPGDSTFGGVENGSGLSSSHGGSLDVSGSTGSSSAGPRCSTDGGDACAPHDRD